jgi:iron-sulfur cluster insertion protein
LSGATTPCTQKLDYGATMSGIETYIPAPLNITEQAVTKVDALKVEEGNDDLKLRVYVTGGGCSGFQYGFSFEDVMAEDDTAVTRDGVTVLIDSLSYQYLVGSTVDYEVGLMGSRFLITNPNASTTCGCGASFSI